jgi:hypothetical protein|tara:strand:- start:1264 stop:1902 length:639 start_codon:yes stop_codon:yes gene_type:complete
MTSEELQQELGFVRAELTISVRGEHHVAIFVPKFDTPYVDLYGLDSGPEWPEEKVLCWVDFDRKSDADKLIKKVNKEWDTHRRRRLDGGFYTEANADGWVVGHDDDELLNLLELNWYDEREGAEKEAREILKSDDYKRWLKGRDARKALERYRELKNELLEFTSEFHDAMYYDISGYEYEELDEDCLNDLRNQIEAFESILSGLKKIKYIYG